MNFDEKYYNSNDFDKKDKNVDCCCKCVEKSCFCCPVKWAYDKKKDDKCDNRKGWDDNKCCYNKKEDENCGCEEKQNKCDDFKSDCEEKKDNRNFGCNRCNRCYFFRGFRF